MSDAEDSELRRANDNPWYRLATLYGEQMKGANCWTWDKELAAKNRMAWNRWMARVLSDEQRATLVGKGLPEQELLPLTPAETSALRSAFAARSGREKEGPPDPAKEVVLDFAHTDFDVAVVFDGFLCALKANFGSATFSEYVRFQSTIFSGDASFSSATFSEDADFSSATFSGKADFSSATFSGSPSSGYAIFNSTTFSGYADFKKATFAGYYAQFKKATFSGYSSSAMFSGAADFSEATFTAIAWFSSAAFSGNANFRKATFSKGAYFGSTTLSEIASGATFSGNADFRSAIFSEVADFRSATFSAQKTPTSAQPRSSEKPTSSMPSSRGILFSPTRVSKPTCRIFGEQRCMRPPNGMV
jgi:uncharacterized protein YjbI with pentapeptide repeats